MWPRGSWFPHYFPYILGRVPQSSPTVGLQRMERKSSQESLFFPVKPWGKGGLTTENRFGRTYSIDPSCSFSVARQEVDLSPIPSSGGGVGVVVLPAGCVTRLRESRSASLSPWQTQAEPILLPCQSSAGQITWGALSHPLPRGSR